jgi:photosystem II stability/assembly factor-like uncharacterized protein
MTKLKILSAGNLQVTCFLFLISLVLSQVTYSQWVMEKQTNVAFTYVSVVDSGVVWVAGTNQNCSYVGRRSSTGIWDSIPRNGLFAGQYVTCIAAKDMNTAWVTDAYGVHNGGAHIYKTTNAGLNWIVQVSTSDSLGFFNGIEFSRINPSFGYAWSDPPNGNGSPLKIYKTTDGGNSWFEYSILIPNNYLGTWGNICVTDSNHAWFSLFNNTGMYDTVQILYTSNGGVNFSVSRLNWVGYTARALSFKYNNLFGISTIYGILNNYWSTINGGSSWSYFYTIQNIGNAVKLLWVPNSTVWYLATDAVNDTLEGQSFYKTYNDGLVWNVMDYPFSNDIRIQYMDGILMGNKYYAYAVGFFGKIYRLVDTISLIGIKNNSNTIPKTFQLYQNYPNPFNPSTKIKFEVPKETFVNLIIYDILGREIAVLVNEQLKAGIYDIEWNGYSYASGLYLYRLTAGNFTVTKKMMSLK